MKVCSRCHEEKEESQFHKDKSSRDGLNHRCIPCDRTQKKGRYDADPEKFRSKSRERQKVWRESNPTRTRENWVWTTYRLTPERYAELLTDQNGGCAICGEHPTADQRLAVDHDHSCCAGRRRSCGLCIRGLLCFGCNTAIGKLRTVANVEAALQYLTRR